MPGPPSTCKIGVEFFDANSNLVNAQTVSLVPGQSAQVTFTRSYSEARHWLFIRFLGEGRTDRHLQRRSELRSNSMRRQRNRGSSGYIRQH